MGLISTRVHAVLDYVTVASLFAAPRSAGWSDRTTGLFTTAAGNTLLYSLLTRYELGAVKVLPVNTHLFLDAMSGGAFCAAALALRGETTAVRQALLAFGLFEILAVLLTDTEQV